MVRGAFKRIYPEMTGSPLVLLELEKIAVTLFLASASCTLDWFFQLKEGLPVKPNRSGTMICDWEGRTERAGAI